MINARAAKRRFRVALAGLVLFMTTAASFCAPSDPFADAPVVIRRTPDGAVEVSYVHCEGPDGVVEFSLATPGPTIDADEEAETITVWEVVFDEPTVLDGIVLGEVPPGGREEVPWPEGGLDNYPPDAQYFAHVSLDRYPRGSTWFRVSDLEEGNVWFDDQNMTPDEFADADHCRD